MKRLLIAVISMFIVMVPQPAMADDIKWTRSRVCVERHYSMPYWGVKNAIREWNSVDATQPWLYLSDNCPYYGSIHIRTVYRPGWYGGLAANITSDSRIVRTVIVLNNYAGQGLSDERRRTWRRFATLHEFGHALGLHHNLTQGSVMCYCTSYLANGGNLHWSDRRNLRRLY